MPPATRVRAFLLVFSGLFLLALILTIASEFSDAAWINAAGRIGDGLGRLSFVCVAVTFILVEGVPMLAAWVKREEIREAREQGRTEGRAEGIVEGRAEGIVEGRDEGIVEGRAEERGAWLDWRRELQAWEQRKAAAESEGRAFDEPPPEAPADP